jgi:TonB-dependent receptor
MMTSYQQALFCAASLLTISVVVEPAAAQTTTAAAPSSTPEVVVTGLRASLRDAVAQKRLNTEIVETISSKDIGALPDVTIAEELNRLPGISSTRDRGNDSQAAVRGLGPRLVLGLVDGREVASSEPDRNVRWEIYPSEAVSGVTVYKTQSADLIAGGVAATIDLRTLRPLDYSGPSFVLRLGPQFNESGETVPHYSPWGLRGSAQYVAKLSDTFAVAVGGSYQSQKNGYTSFQGWTTNNAQTGSPPIINGQVTTVPYGAQTEVDALTEDRASFTGAAQWKPNSHLQVNYDLLYSQVNIDEDQYQAWYGRNNWGDWGGNSANSGDPYNGAPTTIVNGDLVGATLPYSSVTNVIAHYKERKSLLATGLNGVWKQDEWTFKGDLSYSKAERVNSWRAIFSEVYPSSTTFNLGAHGAPSIVTSSDPANPSNQAVQSWLDQSENAPLSPWQRISDELMAAQGDVARDVDFGWINQLSAGVRASNRVKGQRYDTAEQSYDASSIALPSSMLSEFDVKGLTVPNMLYGKFDQLESYIQSQPGYKLTTEFVPSNYWRVQETDVEAYLKANYANEVLGHDVAGNFGIRVVHVDTVSDGYGNENNGVYTPVTGRNGYTEPLPSVNANITLTDDTKLRLGAARVMSRPPLDELRAGRSLYNTAEPFTGTAGNPKLKPFLANQVDASYEWYFHPESLAAVAIYYKQVDHNIGYKQDNVSIDGSNYLVTGPFNGKGGRMDGVEFTFQTPFYFAPYLEHFGVYSNLALADSDIKELAPSNNPLPMVGLARTTAELDLWYSQFGIDARLGYKYHSATTTIYGWDASQLTRLEAESTLGFSASYVINRNMSVRFQANNLTDQVARYYWNNDPNQLARYDRYGRSYLLDFTFKY